MIDQSGNTVVDRSGRRLAVGDRVGSWRREVPGTVEAVTTTRGAVSEDRYTRRSLDVLRVLHDGDTLSTSYSIEGGRADVFLLNTTARAAA